MKLLTKRLKCIVVGSSLFVFIPLSISFSPTSLLDISCIFSYCLTYLNLRNVYIYEKAVMFCVHRKNFIHAWICPKWLNRILLSLKMSVCRYQGIMIAWPECARKELTSWYVLKFHIYRFSLSQIDKLKIKRNRNILHYPICIFV